MSFLLQENHQRPDFLGILSFTSWSMALYIQYNVKDNTCHHFPYFLLKCALVHYSPYIGVSRYEPERNFLHIYLYLSFHFKFTKGSEQG
jgi:hypothetical protein